MVNTGESKIERAVPGLVLRGEKQEISALSIRIKGISQEDKNNLLKMIAEKVCLYRAVFSDTKEGVLALFNLSTRQFKHELEAIKAAVEIALEANKLKVNFGMGINRGEAIISKEGNVIKYTCLGDAIHLAKKLSNKALKEVLVSKAVHEVTEDKIKAEKSEKASEEFGQEIFSVVKVSERDKYKPYIDSFVRKFKEEEAQRQKQEGQNK